MSADPLIRWDGAVYGYDGRAALGPIDLAVARGEVVAVLGANGSGKSTLVRGLLGLVEQLDGSVELFGEPAHRSRHRDRVGYVPQHLPAAGAVPATVAETVATGRRRNGRVVLRPTASDRAAIEGALDRVGLSGCAGRRVADLSGGQQRRVMVARAFVSDPELLVLDEPTAGVDAENQQRVADALTSLVGEGVTVLLVAHELGPAEPILTRALVLDRGRIVYDGPPLPQHRSHDGGADHHHHTRPAPAVAPPVQHRW